MKNSRYNIYHSDGGVSFAANTMTGSCVLLTQEELTNLRDESYRYFSAVEIEEFMKQGLIIEDEIDEIKLLRYAFNHSRYSLSSSVLTIATTLECNFRCVYCYENTHVGVMNESIQEAVISFIRNLITEKGIKNLHIGWYGGEPLLYPRIIEHIGGEAIRICDEHQVSFTSSIITNGYLISTSMMDILRKVRVSRIQITLDGDENSHNKRRVLKNGLGTYDKIVESIRSLAESDFSVNVRVNVDKDNIDKYEYVKDLFAEYNNITCYPARITLENMKDEIQKKACFKCGEFDEYYERIPLEGRNSIAPSMSICTADQPNSYVISPEGYLMKCFNDVCNIKMAVGHVSDERVNGAYAMALYMGRDPFTEPECSECPYLPQCYGGCINEYRKNGVHSCMEVMYLFIRRCIENIRNAAI